MNVVQLNVLYIAAIANAGLGVFLIIDSLFIHSITFAYLDFGVTSTPYWHHAFLGLFFAAMGLFLFWIAKSQDRRRE